MIVTDENKRLLLEADEIIINFKEQYQETNVWKSQDVTIDLHFINKPDTNFTVNNDENYGRGHKFEVVLKGEGLIKSGQHDAIKEGTFPSKETYLRYSREESNRFCPAKGSWVFLAAKQDANLKSILNTLPIDSRIVWRVILDNNNHLCVKNKLHADELQLAITKDELTNIFLVDYSITEDCSSRFGYVF
jgi:hypothetical protein